MKKWLKLSLFVTLGSLLSLLILLIVLSSVLDPNDYKQDIEALAETKIGRKLTLEGDLHWTVFPWLGISTGPMSLSNAPGFSEQPFVAVDALNIHVKLLPLLQQKIELNQINIKGLRLSLEKNQQGTGNWVNLGGPAKAQNDDPMLALAAFAIGGVNIENAQLSWDDRQTNKKIVINNFNLESDKIEFNQPVTTSLSLNFHDANTDSSHQVNLATQWQLDNEFENIKFKDLDITLLNTGPTIPGNELAIGMKAVADINLKQQTLDIPQLTISSGALILNAKLNGKNLFQTPIFSGTVATAELNPQMIMQQFDIPIPRLSDQQALTRLTLQTDVEFSPELLILNKVSIILDDTKMDAQVKVANFKQPVITFTVAADSINLDRYLPPKTSNSGQQQGGSPTESVGTPSTAVAAGLNLFPVETLRQLNIQGDINVDQVIVNNMKLQKISLHLIGNEGQLRSEQAVLQVYQGQYQGQVKVDVTGDKPKVSINEHLSRIQLEPLLTALYGQAKMTGLINLSATLQAVGNSEKTLKSSTYGNLEFTFKEGVIKGFNLPKMIADGKAFFNKTQKVVGDDKNETHYSQITATAKVRNGVVNNDDLLVKSSDLRVTGSGTVDINTELLNYKITAKLLKQAATSTQPEKISGVPVVVDVRGSIKDPRYQLNIKETIPKEKQQKIIQEVEKKLGKDVGKLLKNLFK